MTGPARPRGLVDVGWYTAFAPHYIGEAERDRMALAVYEALRGNPKWPVMTSFSGNALTIGLRVGGQIIIYDTIPLRERAHSAPSKAKKKTTHNRKEKR